MCSPETQLLVKADGLRALFVGGKLHDMRPPLPSPGNRPSHQLPAQASVPKTAVYAHRFDLGAQPALVIEVAQKSKLQRAHEPPGLVFCDHQFLIGVGINFPECLLIRGWQGQPVIFPPLPQFIIGQQLNEGWQVGCFCFSEI